MPESTPSSSIDWRALAPELQWDLARPAPADAGARPVSTASLMREAGFAAFLDEVLADGRPITLLLNDGHRMTDSRSFLEGFFEVLDAAPGTEAITLRALIAAGSHKADADERALHEDVVFGHFRPRIAEVAWHDAFDPEGLVQIGATRLHRWMGEQGAYIACGSMEPHYFAGVTGAHKTLTVGVMAHDTLTANHAGAMSAQAAPLKLDGNPVYLGIVDALADLEDSGAKVFALNQVLVEGEVVAATAGHPLESLSRGLELVTRHFGKQVEAAFDLVVAVVEHPLNRDFYQAEKGIKNTESVVVDGGAIILEADCARGVGIDHFVGLLEAAPSAAEARKAVQERGYQLGDHKAVRLRALTDTRSVRVVVVSAGLRPELGAILGVEVVRSRAEALELLQLSQGSRALLVEDAGNCVPWLEDSRGPR